MNMEHPIEVRAGDKISINIGGVEKTITVPNNIVLNCLEDVQELWARGRA